MEKKTKKIVVEKGTYEKDGKVFDTYFIRGKVRGQDVVAGVKPPDFGGYKILEIVFNGAKEAELEVNPFEMKAENGDVISGNTYKVVSYDDDGTVYECPVKPARTSDKTMLTATDNDETAAIAKKYGVSQGKAQLIADAKKNSSMSEEDIASLPLDELIASQKEVDSTIIDSKYIGILKAKTIALNDSGCTARVEFTEARLIDKGVKYPYYRLVFNDKRTQWTYLINAVNGDILEKNEVVLFISLEEAKDIALKDAGIKDKPEVKVVFTKEELSRNSGRPCWILEFYTEKYQFGYKVDVKTGEVIFSRRYIYIERAREIALNDAGIEDVDRVEFTVEELVDGGIKTPYYLFKFNNGHTQWTYCIDATDGGIQFADKEDLK